MTQTSLTEAIEFEIKYSLADYYRVVTERASRLFQAKRSVRARRLKAWLWLIGAALLGIGAIGAIKAGFIWGGAGLSFAAFALALNGMVLTQWGYGHGVPWIACLVAICLRKLRPTYRFKIDEKGIRRTAGTRDYFVPWEEVVRVDPYSNAFVIEIKTGAMPILYRALSPSQRERLELAFPASLAQTG